MEWLGRSSFVLNSVVYRIVEIECGTVTAVNWKGQQLKFPQGRLRNITIERSGNDKK